MYDDSGSIPVFLYISSACVTALVATTKPSSEECREITEDICAHEFQTAASIVADDQLPQCQLLPDTALKCNGKI